MQQKIFAQRIVYLVALLVLIVMLYVVGRPAKVVWKDGETKFDGGGVLAQRRDYEELSESLIGEIDPASSTVKLATFGMRGVAIAVLWHRCQEYQKKLDWNNVIAISNQLVFLEPHFTTIWEFLGWNLSYNASAEFDDYRERYRWVIRGVDFQIRGVEYNRRAPRLCKATGWTISQKIGIADENEQYRRLLREDDDFWQRHDKLKLPSERDNWILGRRWYHMGEELVKQGIRFNMENESDFLYFSNSRLNLFNYAMWKRKDGIFGVEAQRAWERAGDEWIQFGKTEYSTAIPTDGTLRMRPGVEAFKAKLETTDIKKREKAELIGELNELKPGFRRQLCVERWKELGETPGQQGTLLGILESVDEPKSRHDTTDYTDFRIVRDWLNENELDWKVSLKADLDKLYKPEELELKKVPKAFLDDEQRDIVTKADSAVDQIRGRCKEMMLIGPKVFAQELQKTDVPPKSKSRARDIAEEIDGFAEVIRRPNLFRDILNYEHRIREVAVESTEEVDLARKIRYEARNDYRNGDYRKAARGWVAAMQSWEDFLNRPEFEDVGRDPQFLREILDIVEKYVIILDVIDEIFTGKEPLQQLTRNKLDSEFSFPVYFQEFDYAKNVFEQGDFEKAEKYFQIVCRNLDSLNMNVEYLKLAPLPDLRDMTVQANAYYIKSLRKQGKALPEPLPLRSYVELVMKKQDPEVGQAITAIQNGIPLLEENKPAEAQKEFEKAIELWKAVLDKYPIIPLDPTLSMHAEVRQLVDFYSRSLKAQDKEIPDDFPFKEFLK